MGSESPPESTRKVLVEGFSLFRRAWSRLLVFGSIYAAFAFVVLVPFVVWLSDNALALDGTSASLNFDIASSVFSLVGVLALFVWSLGTATLVLLGLGGQVLIATDASRGGARPLRRVWSTILSATPRLVRPGIMRIALFGMLAITIITFVLGTLKALVVASDENLLLTFLPDSLVGQVVFVAILVGVALLCYAVLIRWTFVLHAMVLENRGLGDAMRRSVELVAKARGSVLRTLVSFHLLVLVVLGVVAGVSRLLALLLFGVIAPEPSGLFVTLAGFLVVVNSVGSAILVAAVGGFGASLGTVMFTRLGGILDPSEAPEAPVGGTLLAGRRAVWAIVAIFVLGFALAMPRIVRVVNQRTDYVGVTAHRGSSAKDGGAPENTMAAFRLAIEQGADMIELDVMEAEDGSVVVVHDPNLKRLAGVDRAVYEMTLPELQALDVGSHFDPSFAGERIPTLKDVIDLVRGKVKLNIELKTHGHEKDFPASVVRLIEDEKFVDQCVVTSLDYGALEKVRALDPGLRIGAIVTASVGNVYGLDVDFYSLNQKRATPAFLRRAHARDREVHVWTVNSEASIQLMIDRGVDNVITDYPVRAIELRGARTNRDELRGVLVRLFDR